MTPTDNQPELKPCAHCGGECMIEHSKSVYDSKVYYGECINCGNGTKFQMSIKEVAEHWNRRATPPAPEASGNELSRLASARGLIGEAMDGLERLHSGNLPEQIDIIKLGLALRLKDAHTLLQLVSDDVFRLRSEMANWNLLVAKSDRIGQLEKTIADLRSAHSPKVDREKLGRVVLACLKKYASNNPSYHLEDATTEILAAIGQNK